jgi:hypothetical protein
MQVPSELEPPFARGELHVMLIELVDDVAYRVHFILEPVNPDDWSFKVRPERRVIVLEREGISALASPCYESLPLLAAQHGRNLLLSCCVPYK